MAQKPITPPETSLDEDLEADWKRLRGPNTGGKGHVRYLTGKVFGYLEVIEQAKSDKHGTSCWSCRCRLCGTVKTFTRPALTSGRVKSCGCLKSGKSKDPEAEPEVKPLWRNRTYWATLRNESNE